MRRALLPALVLSLLPLLPACSEDYGPFPHAIAITLVRGGAPAPGGAAISAQEVVDDARIKVKVVRTDGGDARALWDHYYWWELTRDGELLAGRHDYNGLDFELGARTLVVPPRQLIHTTPPLPLPAAKVGSVYRLRVGVSKRAQITGDTPFRALEWRLRVDGDRLVVDPVARTVTLATAPATTPSSSSATTAAPLSPPPPAPAPPPPASPTTGLAGALGD